MKFFFFLIPLFLFASTENLSLDSYITKKGWERIGFHDHYGIDLTLLGLVTNKSSGNGEYYDLLPMIDFLEENGFDILQVLPLNNTGGGISPYDPISSNALSPIFLSLEGLPFLDQAPKSLQEGLLELKKYNQTPRVEYNQVWKLKEAWIKEYISLFCEELEKDPNYEHFLVSANDWLTSYAIFKELREKYGPIIKKWPKDLQQVSDVQLKGLEKEHQKGIRFFQAVQFLCYQQLSHVHQYAHQKGVFLLGDMSFMVDANSVDVWRYPHLFKLDYSEGSGLSPFSPKGANWGMPPYDWEQIEQTGYFFFRDRLKTMSQYYDIFRMDHASGFFSQFEIPNGKPPSAGKQVPESKSEMLAAGKKHLTAICGFTEMLPTAEDFLFTCAMRDVLYELGIPGIRLFAYINSYDSIDHLVLNGYHYNRMTITSFADHDFPPFRSWWLDNPERAKAFAKQIGWTYTPTPTLKEQEELMWLEMHSNSLLHIELLQDLLPPNLTHSPKNDRINTPGTVNDLNWTYRYKLTVEELTTNPEVKAFFKTILSKDPPLKHE
jgi:4-alpha-glucanotransferase